ncbi:RNA polymerase sigma factor [Mycoplasmatota bacterium WC44]
MEKHELNKLVAMLKRGDMSVFDDIYHETKKGVYFTILSILKNQQVSEDVMQEVYIKALHNIHNFDNRNFNAWIIKIARNMAINEYNRNKKSFSVDQSESDYLFVTKSDSDEQLLLNDMMRFLKENESEVVLMHVIGNLTHKEIARILEKPIGTILWLYNQAMKKLRNKLEVR